MVIGVVILVGGLSLPFTLRELDRRRETEAVDRLGLLVRLARVESRAGGVPLEVRCDAAGRRISVLRIDPRDPPVLGTEGMGFESTDALETRLRASWSTVELPESLTIVPTPVDEVDGMSLPEGFGVEPDLGAGAGEDPWPDSTRLLLLTPDGTAIPLQAFGLRSPEGWRRVRVDPWTARVTIEESSAPGFEDSMRLDEETIDPELDARAARRPDSASDPIDAAIAPTTADREGDE